MMLLPLPSRISENGKSFSLTPEFEIVLDLNCGHDEFRAAKSFKAELQKILCLDIPIEKSAVCSGPALFIRKTDSPRESYRLEINGVGAELSGGGAGIFWGIQTLRQIVRQCGGNWPGLLIEDSPKFAVRGFFHDVTRGKVPSLETLKDLADRLAFYKANQLQLYVEHTFAFRGFSEAWTGKDPLTAEEILELDEYCAERRIELVPSLATFGHLYEILATKTWRKYCELEVDDAQPFAWYERMAHHTLNASDPGSFEMVRSMLDQYLPLFSSRKVNIGCDETFDVGCGKSAELARKIGRDGLYAEFLKKIVSYLQAQGKEVMFWSDMILKSPGYLRDLPEKVQCLYWNYGSDVGEKDFQTIAESGAEFLACPGVCGWNCMMNLFGPAFENISRMVRFGVKYGAKGILNTDWGDYGHVNLFANSMPGMAAGAALSWNPDDRRAWEQIFEAYCRLEFGDQSSDLPELLTELPGLQADIWADVVCWRESQVLGIRSASRDRGRLMATDDEKALRGYRRALEIEKLLSAFSCVENRCADLREYVCSARGVALMNAAGLAIKKYAYGSAETPLAEGCEDLAVHLELWLARFAALWRGRNRESELYRIRETVQCLCGFLRDWESKKDGNSAGEGKK